MNIQRKNIVQLKDYFFLLGSRKKVIFFSGEEGGVKAGSMRTKNFFEARKKIRKKCDTKLRGGLGP